MIYFLLACTSTDTGSKDSGADTQDTGVDSEETAVDSDSVPPEPGVWWFTDVIPVDVAPTGATALFQSMTSIEGELFILDTESWALTSVTTLGDATKDMATGLSEDGRISALHGLPVEAGVWDPADGWTDLPSPYATGCDPDNGGAFDLSDDGAVVVGLMWEGCAPAAFRWTDEGGVLPLERLGEGYEGSLATNRATVVSGDGQVVAGFAANGVLDRTPAVWAADGSGSLLDAAEQDVTGEVLSIDRTGATLAGLRGMDGFLWTDADGYTDLGRVDTALPTDPVYPNALSADGRLAFGGVGSEYFTVPVAFVWSAADGMRALQPLLADAGIDLGGATLTSVVAVSDDGSTLIGRAFDADFALVSFVVRVDPAVYGG